MVADSPHVIRFDSLAGRLDDIADRLGAMDTRARAAELEIREALVVLRQLRELIDTEAAARKDHATRITALEHDRSRREGGLAVSIGAGAGSGGVVAGIVEFVRHLLT